MKTLISLLTSFQLLFLQVVIPIAVTNSMFSSTQVHAEDDVEEEHSEEEEEGNSEDVGDGISNAAGDAAGEVMGLFKGASVSSSADIMNFVMLLLIGLITASLFGCTKYSADIIVAAIGGVMYIGAEIMQLFQSEAKYEQEGIEYSQTTTGAPDLDEKQTDAFTAQREGYMEAKQAAEKKANLQKAASTSWYAAAAIAMTFYLARDAAATACVTAGTVEAAATPPNPACSIAVASAVENVGTSKAPKSSIVDFNSDNIACTRMAGCLSCGFFSSMILNSNAACTTAMVTLGLDDSFKNILHPLNKINTPVVRMSMETNEELLNSGVLLEIIEKATNLIFPVASAANPLVTLFGGFGGGIAIFYMFKKSLGTVIDTMLGTPFKRAIVFAVLGALGNSTSKKQLKVADKMQDNVDKINGILQRFNNLSQANQMINNAYTRGQNLTAVPLRAGTRISSDDKPFPCLSMNKKKKCVSSKSMLDNKLAQSKIDLPDGLAGVAGLAGTTADGFAGRSTLSKGTVDGVNSLGKKLSSVRSLNARLREKANKQLKKNKKKPINFAKLENNFLKKLEGSMLKTMKRQKISPSKLLSAVSPNTNPASFGADKDVKDQLKDAVVETTDSKVATQGGSKNKRSAGGFHFKLDDEDADALNTKGLDDEEGLDGLAEGELEVDDIVQDPSVSIFKVISVRYLKSGYPRVLEKKKK